MKPLSLILAATSLLAVQAFAQDPAVKPVTRQADGHPDLNGTWTTAAASISSTRRNPPTVRSVLQGARKLPLSPRPRGHRHRPRIAPGTSPNLLPR